MRPMGFRVGDSGEKTKAVAMPCDFQHGICTGMTGSGKTASLILPVMKDRLQRGHGVLAYTYKGHEHLKIKHLAKEAGRLEDVIEIGKPHGKYINLMASLDQNGIRDVLEELISGLESKGGDYWTLAAARLGANVVDILRKIHNIDTLMSETFEHKPNIRRVIVEESAKDEKKLVDYEYPKGEPSFKMLAEIVKTPKTLKHFYSGLDGLIRNIRRVVKLEKELYFQDSEEAFEYSLFIDEKVPEELDGIEHTKIRKVVLSLLRLEKTIAPYKGFIIDTNSDDGTGNNGVLQVLNNAVLNLANKDYINIDDVDLLESLGNHAVVIVDIEGIESEIHGVMLDSILGKLAARVRHGVPQPVSVFVDEANRVLSGDMDIHNDVLREAKVELILAAQNEEQMVEKFGEVKWESLRKNFKHNYWIDQEHIIAYNESRSWKAEAILIESVQLLEAEYAFNSLMENRRVYEKRFLFTGDLPKRFSVEYDIVQFEKDMTLNLIDPQSIKKEVEYIGQDLKAKLENEMVNLGFGSSKTLKINI